MAYQVTSTIRTFFLLAPAALVGAVLLRGNKSPSDTAADSSATDSSVIGSSETVAADSSVTGNSETIAWPNWHSLSSNSQPTYHFSLPAESADWDVRRLRTLRDLFSSTKSASKWLDAIEADDGPQDGPQDTWVWRNLTANDTTVDKFWQLVCNGTKERNSSSDSLDGWNVAPNMSCAPEDIIGTANFTSESMAVMACGGTCGAIYDIGCKRQKFGLCKIGGGPPQPSVSGSCLRLRVPDQAPPAGHPGLPHEEEFWKNFCSVTQGAFRLLFKRRLCKAGKALEGAHTEAHCAEKVAADTACSKVFDFDADPDSDSSSRCRCVLKGAACEAAAPPAAGTTTSSMPAGHTHDQNVYMLNLLSLHHSFI